MQLATIASGLLAASLSQADDAGQRLPKPYDAAAAAAQDAASSPDDAAFWRYIWIPPLGSHPIDDQERGLRLAVQQISRASVPIPVTPVSASPRVCRLDLRAVAAGRPADLVTLTQTWERLASREPYFLERVQVSALVVIEEAELIRISADNVRKVLATIPAESGVVPIGREDDNFVRVQFGDLEGWIKKSKVKGETAARVPLRQPAAHCLGPVEALVSLTGSGAPIVRADWWYRMALTTLDGGLYYEFAGVPATQAEFLESIGASQELVAKLGSDRRVAMFRSEVTGKPRAVSIFPSANGSLDVCQGLVAITEDIEDDDATADPIRDLLDFQFAATEVIAEKSNGMPLYALFDGQGNRQAAAPDNVVRDHTVPAPHTARLQPWMSCARCHGPHDGWQPIKNDVLAMLGDRVDIVGERNDGLPLPETVARLAGLYSWRSDKPLRRARDDFAEQVARITGVPDRDDENGERVSTAATHFKIIADSYGRYVWDLVDASTALEELGYHDAGENSAAALGELLPPVVADEELGLLPEDPMVLALRAGLSINRRQFEEVYPDLANRAAAREAAEVAQQVEREP